MLNTLSKQYLGQDYGASKTSMQGAVTMAQIPKLAEESFPLCMRNCQDHIATHHHLRHGARMQYGLFLKVSLCHLRPLGKSRSFLQAIQPFGAVTVFSFPLLSLFWRHLLSFSIPLHTKKRKKENIKRTRSDIRSRTQGIGMTLEEALLFWRSEFTKAITGEQFEKRYAYNIRHNFGKEGKRTDYTPYSCMKIIMSNAPAAGDAHGCPFKHFDDPQLRELLVLKHRVPAQVVDEILAFKRNQHYQIACTRYFEATHNIERSDLSLQHPNQYFEESRRVRTGKGVATSDGVVASGTAPPSAAVAYDAPDEQVRLQRVSCKSTIPWCADLLPFPL